MNGQEITIVLCFACVFLSPAAILATIFRHREKMAMLKNKADVSPALVEEVKRLRTELTELRQTATHFDMSFDAALQRVEQRLSTVEEGPAVMPTYPEPRRTVTTEEQAPVILRR